MYVAARRATGTGRSDEVLPAEALDEYRHGLEGYKKPAESVCSLTGGVLRRARRTALEYLVENATISLPGPGLPETFRRLDAPSKAEVARATPGSSSLRNRAARATNAVGG